LRREENRRTRRKTLRARTRTNNKLNPLMTPGPEFESGPHWWKASASTGYMEERDIFRSEKMGYWVEKTLIYAIKMG